MCISLPLHTMTTHNLLMETDGHHAHQWCNGAIMGDPVVSNRKKTTTQNCLKTTTQKTVFLNGFLNIAFENSF